MNCIRIFFLYSLLLYAEIALSQNKATILPNVIIINMDDMGYGDTEPYGMTGISTPNFNRMAKEGMRFTHFNAAQAICTASRAALLTGCYPNRIGIHGAFMPWADKALNPSEETIASLLKKAGYETGMLGKWHLGAKPPYFPTYYGFNSFYGLPYSNDMWPVDVDGNAVTDTSKKVSKFPWLPVIDGEKQVGTIRTFADQEQLTPTLTRKAVSFIENNRNKPFFLYLAHPMPHIPLAASERFKGKSGLGIFGDVIMELDWSLGEIINTLDKERLSEKTILIVTSDNGPWLIYGNNAGSSGGFKEGKGTVWEGGTRVPCLVRWPGKVEAGGVCSQLLTNMDLLPTMCSVTGAGLPVKKIDGIDFSALLLGKTDKGPREVFYYYYETNNLKAVRYKNWKLVFPHDSRSYALGTRAKDRHSGSTVKVAAPQSLYDLAHDPGEAYDVQKLYPDTVKKILRFAEIAREDLGDDLTQRKGKNVREAAKL